MPSAEYEHEVVHAALEQLFELRRRRILTPMEEVNYRRLRRREREILQREAAAAVELATS